MNEHADQPATPGNDAGIPGKTLQSQREAMGWSVEQVADQLKLAPRQVVALEAGDYAALPSPAVTRGFVRAYAKLLKIDAAPLVAKIEMNMPPEAQAGAMASVPRREQRPASFSQSRFPIGGKRNKLPVGLIAGAIALVAAGAALWHFGLIPLGQQPEADTGAVLEAPVVAPGVPAGQDAVLNPSVPLISVPAPAGEGAAAPAAVPSTTPAPAPGTGAAPVAAPPVAAPAATLAAPVTAVPAPAGANALVLEVREDSWIEVRPARGGKALISRLVKGGSTETFEVAEPVNVVVGNPAGVSATLRGASVSLPQQPGKTIARVALK
ncbi:helix-turn-helix domain-containing protein [Massilia yuzhufengensis]|uniref:Cytoskeleton protein RodZ n=1 Tax=Massilia yuzhufengensis TaxID=1164594 RepID=A0A1I1HAJ4_9BURK|nr:helix-turn-helix domain-containing protein [Massilia yuzhufengensis]SFC20786.1 cytoskeleton protein RodZ [Massilia yuzhufengensis]